jgi:hypothetical protein
MEMDESTMPVAIEAGRSLIIVPCMIAQRFGNSASIKQL